MNQVFKYTLFVFGADLLIIALFITVANFVHPVGVGSALLTLFLVIGLCFVQLIAGLVLLQSSKEPQKLKGKAMLLSLGILLLIGLSICGIAMNS